MPYRLGDDADDYCIKCKRLTNHAIVSMVGDDPAKVRCRTCYHEHDFKNGEIPPSKKDLKKMALFNEVAAKVNPEGVGAAAVEPEPEDAAKTDAAAKKSAKKKA